MLLDTKNKNYALMLKNGCSIQDFLLIGATNARVARSSVFTRAFSNQRVRSFRLLFIIRERFDLAS